jgi:hypothetical protein
MYKRFPNDAPVIFLQFFSRNSTQQLPREILVEISLQDKKEKKEQPSKLTIDGMGEKAAKVRRPGKSGA